MAEVMGRKIVSIAADNHRILAVCDDGTLWLQTPASSDSWSPVGPIPLAEAPPPDPGAMTEGTHSKKAANHGR